MWLSIVEVQEVEISLFSPNLFLEIKGRNEITPKRFRVKKFLDELFCNLLRPVRPDLGMNSKAGRVVVDHQFLSFWGLSINFLD